MENSKGCNCSSCNSCNNMKSEAGSKDNKKKKKSATKNPLTYINLIKGYIINTMIYPFSFIK